jgi:hypothetical protein
MRRNTQFCLPVSCRSESARRARIPLFKSLGWNPRLPLLTEAKDVSLGYRGHRYEQTF